MKKKACRGEIQKTKNKKQKQKQKQQQKQKKKKKKNKKANQSHIRWKPSIQTGQYSAMNC